MELLERRDVQARDPLRREPTVNPVLPSLAQQRLHCDVRGDRAIPVPRIARYVLLRLVEYYQYLLPAPLLLPKVEEPSDEPADNHPGLRRVRKVEDVQPRRLVLDQLPG